MGALELSPSPQWDLQGWKHEPWDTARGSWEPGEILETQWFLLLPRTCVGFIFVVFLRKMGEAGVSSPLLWWWPVKWEAEGFGEPSCTPWNAAAGAPSHCPMGRLETPGCKLCLWGAGLVGYQVLGFRKEGAPSLLGPNHQL